MIDRTRPRATVLVVDDERGPRESLRMILAPVYRVLAVASGSEALDVMRTTEVDVVTLDLAMPGLRGAELMRTLRGEFPDIEVIVITGHGTLESATEGIRWGVADYLQKPFDVMQVTAAVWRALARRRGRGRMVRFLEELGDLVGRDTHVDGILSRIESDAGLRGRLGELLARSAAELPAETGIDPERALPFFEVLAQAVESQDPWQRGHGQRVAFYATLLADRLCLSAEQKRRARIAAFLHDIGKIGVPGELLARRGSLTEVEHRSVERHTEVGARLLAPLGLGTDLVAAVRHHHERWDGAGYPDGIAGEAIPLTARIVQIADAYDAMTSDRPWRRARTQSAALAELRREAGRQFDPGLTKDFVALVESGVCDGELDGMADWVTAAAPVTTSAAPSALRSHCGGLSMTGAGSQLALDFGGSASASGSPSSRKVRRDTTVRLVEFAPFPRVRRDQRWRHGFTVDLSARGLCLRAKEAAPMGSLLHVIVRSVDGRPFLDVIARVAWATRGPEGDVRVGLEFVATRQRAPLRVVAGGGALAAAPAEAC